MVYRLCFLFLFIVSLTETSLAAQTAPLRRVRDIMKPDGNFGTKPEIYYDQKSGTIRGYFVYLEKKVILKRFGLNIKSKILKRGGFVTLDVMLRGKNKNGKLILNSGYIESGSLLIDQAVLDDHGRLINQSIARDNSRVVGDAILDNSSLCDSAIVSGNSIVIGSMIYENAVISGNAKVTGSDVSGTSVVKDWAIVSNNSDISGKSKIGNFTRVKSTNDIIDGEYFNLDDDEEDSLIDDDENNVQNAREFLRKIVRAKSQSQL